MGYRRLFIMRKDLNMSAGKLAAQVGHCAEAYWTHLICDHIIAREHGKCAAISIVCPHDMPTEILDQYICGSFVKTICEARNKNHLLKAKETAEGMGLVEGKHFGLIYDNCYTELQPEEEDGTTLTGIWFCPLPDDVSKSISKKYHLYM